MSAERAMITIALIGGAAIVGIFWTFAWLTRAMQKDIEVKS